MITSCLEADSDGGCITGEWESVTEPLLDTERSWSDSSCMAWVAVSALPCDNAEIKAVSCGSKSSCLHVRLSLVEICIKVVESSLCNGSEGRLNTAHSDSGS